MRRLICVWLSYSLLFLLPAVQAQEQEGFQDYYLEVIVTNNAPFVGEQIDYVFRFYAAQLPTGLIYDLPDFADFWVVETMNGAENRVETRNGRQYFVGERRVILAPMRAGTITIEPATLIIPETVFREEERFTTEAITVAVQPLPPGAPDGFNGAVGQFQAEITVDRTALTLGQPIRLTMQITGAGNLEFLSAPDLHFLEGWRVYTNLTRYTVNSVSGLRVGEKFFEWLVIPPRTGSQSFPAISFVFFDPQAGEYRIIVEPSFTVNVLPGDNNTQELPSVDQLNEPITSALSIRPVSAHFRMNSPKLGGFFWLLWIIAPLITVVCAARVYGKQYLAFRRRRAHRATALERTSRRIQEIKFNNPQRVGEQLVAAICGYAADKLGISAKSVKPATIQAILYQRQVAPEIISVILDSLKDVDAIRYVPNELGADWEKLVRQTIATLTDLDGELEKS